MDIAAISGLAPELLKDLTLLEKLLDLASVLLTLVQTACSDIGKCLLELSSHP